MMRLAEAARALGASVSGADATFSGVSTDSRNLKRGDLFVAIAGDRFDGHAFLRQAADAGAAAALVEDGRLGADDQALAKRMPLLVVRDTRKALGALAAHWRKKFTLPLVALTGSSGKTTVKEMLASILEAASGGASPFSPAPAAGSVLATRGNLNNDIGVPLMLLELKESHRYAVIEMGMNHAGEIGYLTGLAAPAVALINNAGSAHMEFLGSAEAVARAKGEIFEGLAAGGTAVINADDAFAPLWRELAGSRRRIEFGLGPSAAVTATYRLRHLESDIVVKTPGGEAAATLRAAGVHNVSNALAASAAAVALDAPLSAIAAGLEAFEGIKGRLQRRVARGGASIIDDTYNANPESMRAAISVLAQAPGRRLLVLGDMGELGADAPRLHAEIGARARAAGIERVLTLGALSAHISETYGPGARHFTRIEDLIAEVSNALGPDVTMLVKGSRFMQMERVVKAFEAAADKPGEKKT
jgi:UDP-N-acetylmuramoyl-tripeptide--D-alanyl-D-alanine ligase